MANCWYTQKSLVALSLSLCIFFFSPIMLTSIQSCGGYFSSLAFYNYYNTKHVFHFKEELETATRAVVLDAVVSKEVGPAGVPFETLHVSMVLEDQVVMCHRSWPDSLNFFGLIYALHLSYDKEAQWFLWVYSGCPLKPWYGTLVACSMKLAGVRCEGLLLTFMLSVVLLPHSILQILDLIMGVQCVV